MKQATGFVVLLLTLTALAVGVRWAFNTSSASPNGSMSCSVKPACAVGEVEVFRMSSLANAHAGSSYSNVVCCGDVAGLGTDCGATPSDVVLSLSAADNAHVASDGSYANDVCLSGLGDDATAVCTYAATCPVDYACLATISGSTNAHVADCDDVNDYATKVCCLVTEDNCPDVSNPGQENTDGDKWGNACDNCPATATPWFVPVGDEDCDGFTTAAEEYVGTDPLDACPETSTPNDEDPDAWPVDMDDDQDADIVDVLKYKPYILTSVPPSPQRFDFDADGDIDIVDILKYKSFILTSCTP